MIKPADLGVSVNAPPEARGAVRAGRADVAMDVLQYGMAIVSIVVVTLLAVAR